MRTNVVVDKYDNGTIASETWYDEKGNIVKHRGYQYESDDVDWDNSYDCEYDLDGNLIEKISYFDDGDAVGYIYCRETFNKDGQLLSKKLYETDTEKYKYDESGKLVEVEVFNGRRLVKTIKHTYECDGAKTVTCHLSNGTLSYEHLYNKKGVLVKSVAYSYEGRKFTTDAVCDSDGNLVSTRYCDDLGNVVESFYNPQGKEVKHREYTSDGKLDWEWSWDATYDKNGKRISEINYNPDGSVKTKTA